MKEPVFVSAVLYVHNEQATVADYLTRLDAFLDQHFETYEILVVNDASTDRTAAAMREGAQRVRGSLTVLTLTRKHGVELGLMAGLDRCVGDFVFELESSQSGVPLEVLRALYEHAGVHDIVAAVPARTSWRSRLFYRMVNRASAMDINLSTETARLVSRRALNAMLSMREKVRYRKVLYTFTGYSRTQVNYAQVGAPRTLNRETLSLAMDIMISFSDWGLRVAHWLSFGFFFLSLFMIGYVAYNYLFRQTMEGWTTIMGFLSFGFAGLFFILGLFGEYLARILIEVRNRPSYSVAATFTYPDRRGEPAEATPGAIAQTLEQVAAAKQ